METISDEYMKSMLSTAKPYTIALLKPGRKPNHPDAQKIIWEHGRRNFALRSSGILSIVCPVTEEGSVNGLYIFNTGKEDVKEILDGDPAVEAGIFVYEIYPCLGFPGDKLP